MIVPWKMGLVEKEQLKRLIKTKSIYHSNGIHPIRLTSCLFDWSLGYPVLRPVGKFWNRLRRWGWEEIHFFGAQKGEPSYASSTLWTTDEWQQKIRAGVAQAFSSHIPLCKHHQDLDSLLGEIKEKKGIRIGMDNYEAVGKLEPCAVEESESIFLAVGAERGWSGDERNQLRENGFTLKHLGKRILRVETAVVAALGILGSGIEA